MDREAAPIDPAHLGNLLIDKLRTAVCLVDAQGLITHANRSASEYFSANTLFLDHICVSDQPVVANLLQDSSQNADQNARIPSVSIRLVGSSNDDGESLLRFLLSVSREPVSGQRIIEATPESAELSEIRDHADTLEHAQDVTADGYWEWNVAENTNVFSDNWYRRLGYAPDEFPASIAAWEKLVHPDDLQPTWDALVRFFRGETPSYSFINRLRKKDGTYRWNQDVAKIVTRDAEGKPVRVIGVDRDISQQQELVEKLRLGQRRESLATLSAGLAHDLNNILSPISILAEMGERNLIPNGDVPAAFSDILEAGNRGAELVKKLMRMTRQMDEEVRPIVVADVVRDSYELCRSSIGTNVHRQLNVESSYAVMCDPVNLEQIVLNLSQNAVQAIGDLQGHLSVSVIDTTFDSTYFGPRGALQSGDDVVQITIADDGCGMTEDVQKCLFDPYFTTKRLGDGAGLGLSVVHGLVESYGGLIAVKSELGKGSEFTIILPRTQKAASCVESASRDMTLVNQRVLLVDDDDAIRKSLVRGLELSGMPVTAFQDGGVAWEAFSRAPDQFDIVVSDLMMPEMSGDELSRRIKEIRPDILFVMISGFGQRQANQENVDAWISKPLSLVDIVYLIRSLLVGHN